MKQRKRPVRHEQTAISNSMHSIFILEKLTAGYICALLSVFLLYPGESGYIRIAEAKRDLFYTISLLYILLSAVCFFLCSFDKKDRAEICARIKNSLPEIICAIAYLIVSIISAACSDYSSVVWLGGTRHEGVVTIALYIIPCILLSISFKPAGYMLYVFGASTTLFAILSIIQFSGANPLSLYPTGMDYLNSPQPFVGTIGNIAFVSAFLCIAIPVLLGGVLLGHKKRRFFLLAPLCLLLIVLVRINVLAGYVGLAAGLVVTLPVFLKTNRRIYYFVVCLAAMTFLLLLCFVPWREGLLKELHQVLHGNIDERFGSGRIYIWREVLRRVPARLWFGYGPDTLIKAGIEPFSRFDPILNTVITSEIDTAHNEYLNMLFHQGIFGLASYAGLLISLARKYVKAANKSTVVAVTGTAALCYLIQSFFGISQLIVAPFLWMVFGCLSRSAVVFEKATASSKMSCQANSSTRFSRENQPTGGTQ